MGSTGHGRQGRRCRGNPAVSRIDAGAGLVGLVIGAGVGWGGMYVRLQPVEQRAAQAEAAREDAVKAAKTLEDQLKGAQQSVEKAQAAGKAAEQSIGETKAQLAAALSGREAAEKTAGDLKGQLAAAVSAREAAEQALAEAKKGAAPSQ